MLKRLLLVVIIASAGVNLSAQDKPAPMQRTWKEKLGWGGNLGLRFGNITYVELSPIAGYRVASFLMPGVGATYRYISYNMGSYGKYANHVYGGSVWCRAYVAQMIFGYAEYELLNGEWDPLWNPDVRSNINTTFVGGGYSQEMGGNSSYIMVLFATAQDGDSIYWNPVIRIGFMIGGSAE